jgi:hypothetical protein
MFLRETRRKNQDGSVVSYLQLAHNQRHPVSGNPVAKVIHNFGRVDRVDRDGLARLVRSISRFLDPEQAVAAAASAGGPPRKFRTSVMGLSYAANCSFRNSLWTSLGVR